MGKVLADAGPANPLVTRAVARNLERVAWLMDRAVKIPGTKINVGLDAVLGLLPIGGDIATGLVQAGVVLVALAHYRVPKAVAFRMMANVLLDMSVGAIPVLGDLFDVAFKANTRNLKLLEPYRQPDEIEDRNPTPTTVRAIGAGRGGTPWRYILPIGAAMLAMLALVVVGFVTVIRWLIA